MEIKQLIKKSDFDQNKKLVHAFNQLNKLLIELKKKDVPDKIIVVINNGIDQINTESGTPKDFIKQLKKKHFSFLKLIEKELKLVTKNHYRNTWMVLGMAAFGLPLGVVFGSSTGNMGLLGIGLPIGMIIGMAVGSKMDKKTFEEGRQLDLET